MEQTGFAVDRDAPVLAEYFIEQGEIRRVDMHPVAYQPVSYTHLDVYKRQQG